MKNFSNQVKIFRIVLFFNLKQVLIKKSTHITGILYFISFVTVPLIFISASTSEVPLSNSFCGIMRIFMYVFNSFFLFMFLYFVSKYYFYNDRQSGIIRVENREGVTPLVSFVTRVFSGLIIAYIYYLLSILTIFIFIGSFSSSYQGLWRFGLISWICYTPIIIFFVFLLSTLFLHLFKIEISTLFFLLLNIIYCISPILSIIAINKLNPSYDEGVINSSKFSVSLKEANNFYYQVNKLKLQKIYYQDYLKEANDDDITRVSDLYTKGNMKDLVYKGIYNDNLHYKGEIFQSIIKPLNIFCIKHQNDLFIRFSKNHNNLFSNKYNDKEFKLFMNILIDKAPDQLANNLLSKEAWIKFLNYLKNEMKYIWENNQSNKNDTLSEFDKDDNNILWSKVLTILPYSYTTDLMENINWELRTLTWEIINLYNISLSPILNLNNYSIKGDIYKEIINSINRYNSLKYFLVDHLFIFNHIYDSLLYTDTKNKFISFSINSCQQYFIGKSIFQLYNVEIISRDTTKKIENMISEQGDGIFLNDENEPYSKYFNVKLNKNFYISLVRIVIFLFGIIFSVLNYYLFLSKSRK